MTAIYWIIEYIATFIETLLCFKFSSVFIQYNSNDKTKSKIVCYTIASSLLVIIVNKIELFTFINGIVGVVMLFVLQLIIYKKKYSFIFLLTMIYAVIVSAVDFSVAQVGAIAFHVNTEYLLDNQSLERCACIAVSKIVLAVIIFFFNKYSLNKMELPKKYIAGMCLIATILVALDYYIIDNNALTGNNEMRHFSIIFFILSIAIIILMFSFVLKIAENYKQKQDMVLLELQNEMIYKAENNNEKAFKMWRSSIHDYKHKIFVIKHWLDEGNIEAVREFINDESQVLEQKIFYIKTGNEIVDAIVNTKQSIAEEKGIIFSMNIAYPKECVISDLDMVCILGNLIDNAIEACENQEKKYIDIIIKEVKKMMIIKVTNSYEGELDIKKGTTKEEKSRHGIGLKNVRSIVDKYSGTYEIVKEQDEVVTTIMILNK